MRIFNLKASQQLELARLLQILSLRYGSIIYFAYFLDSNDTWFPFSANLNLFLMPFERAMRFEVVQRVCIVKYFKCS